MMYFWQDPYVNDPSRHPALKINTKKPFNAEPPMQLLADNFVTPNDIFFIRNHLPVPDIDANTYELEITGEGVKTIKLSLEVGEVALLKRGLSWGEPLDATDSKRTKNPRQFQCGSELLKATLRRGSKNVELVLQHCYKTSWKVTLRVLSLTFKLVLQQIR